MCNNDVDFIVKLLRGVYNPPPTYIIYIFELVQMNTLLCSGESIRPNNGRFSAFENVIPDPSIGAWKTSLKNVNANTHKMVTYLVFWYE